MGSENSVIQASARLTIDLLGGSGSDVDGYLVSLVSQVPSDAVEAAEEGLKSIAERISNYETYLTP